MKILFDMVHPADVHFFKRSIAQFLQDGHEVLITSRKKDLTVELLNAKGFDHKIISQKGKGARGLFFELVRRDVRLWKIATAFSPNIFIANNSPCASHIAWLMRRPSLVFDDTEIHRYNQLLYYPFVTEIHSPSCYRFSRGPKHHFYSGYHSLAYLHPNHFRPNPDILRQAGLDPDENMVLVRFVVRGAMHDIGVKQISVDDKYRLIHTIEQSQAKILISSEGPLPPELEPYRLRMPYTDVHHLLYYVNFVVGESATMCSEAAVLGTPAIYCDESGRGYTDEQEQRYGLCFRFTSREIDRLLQKIHKLLALGKRTKEYFSQAHSRLLTENIDVSAYQIEQIERVVADYQKTA